MKKLFCFDIDGTLRTTTDHQVPESTIKALNSLREKGHLFLVSTGRSVDSLKNTHIYDAFAFDGYVCNSGQALLDKDLKLIHKESLSKDVVLKALEASKKHNIPLALKCTPRIINMEPNEDVIRSCNYFNNPIPPVGSYTNQEVGAMIAYGPLGYDYQEFKDIEELDVMVGESSYADITIKGISKATGIAYFMKLWNMESYVAFGDSLNDIEMFKHASFSICMGQGNNDLKKLLYRAIHEVDIYDSLDDDAKNRVNEYIELIREAFTFEEYFNVYDLCEMGFYLTGLPIFKYYEGKMFYKMEKYGLCIKTLDEYLKTGASKTSKAYLYLSGSYYHLNKLKDSRKYASKVYGTDFINDDSFDYVAPQDRGDDSKKNTTQFTLRMKLEDFYE